MSAARARKPPPEEPPLLAQQLAEGRPTVEPATSGCRHCEADITRDGQGWVARDGSRYCGPARRPQPHAPLRRACPICGEVREAQTLGPHGTCPGAFCGKTIPLGPFPGEHEVLLQCSHPAGHTGNHWAPIPGGGHRSWA